MAEKEYNMLKLKILKKVQAVTQLQESELVLYAGSLTAFVLQQKLMSNEQINDFLSKAKDKISVAKEKNIPLRR